MAQDMILECSPWMPLQRGKDKTQYAMKMLCSNKHLEMLVTDSTYVWREDVEGKNNILAKFSKLNDSIDVETTEQVIELLDYHLREKLEETKSVAKKEGRAGLTITFTHAIDPSVDFIWEFSGERASGTLLREHLTNPLILMVHELIREHGELQDILAQKDMEIEHYKNQGATAPARLQSQTFQPSSFQRAMNQTCAHTTTTSDVSKEFGEFLSSNPVTMMYKRVVGGITEEDEPDTPSLASGATQNSQPESYKDANTDAPKTAALSLSSSDPVPASADTVDVAQTSGMLYAPLVQDDLETASQETDEERRKRKRKELEEKAQQAKKKKKEKKKKLKL